MISQLSIPTLVGYGGMLALFAVAFGHVLELRARRRELLQRLEHSPSNLNVRSESYLLHPTDVVLRRAIREPRLAAHPGIVETWTEAAVFEAIGSLARRMGLLKSMGPLLGFAGSVVGMILGLWLFGVDMNQAVLVQSASLALVTTLGGAFVAIIEVWAMKTWLEELVFRLTNHAKCALYAFTSANAVGGAGGLDAPALPDQALGDTRSENSEKFIEHELGDDPELVLGSGVSSFEVMGS